MVKSKYFILPVIFILLGISYYNQGSPVAAHLPESSPKNRIITEEGKPKTSNANFPGTKDPNFGDPNSQHFEEILRQASDTSQVEADGSSNVKSGNQIASNVVVGGHADQNGSTAENSNDYRHQGEAELDALREAAELYNAGSGSSLIPGARVNGGINAPEVVAPQLAVPTSTPGSTELKEVTGQARGYTMLYLMHPKARQTVEKQVDAMLRSKVQQLYLGVLTDGTFGKDFNYFSNVIRRIAREKRSLVLTVYLSNGSTMRDEIPSVDSPFAEFDPVEFRTLIRINPSLRNQYVELIKPVIPVLQLNKRLNSSNRNFVSVMLEDNLDDESYLAMRSLAQPLLGNRATFIRNPCGGDLCPEGSTRTGVGDPIESHRLDDLPKLTLADAFSLDGLGYRLPAETDERIPSFEDTRNSALTAASRGLKYFGLWRFQRQGNKIGEEPIPVSDRTFEVPSETAILNEIDLLRAGLTEVE
jgi:hypothetical protein